MAGGGTGGELRITDRVAHGGLLKAAAGVSGAQAKQVLRMVADGNFHVWSKYQAPPYFG